MFLRSEIVESMMNRAGAKRVPFLFGVDFELEKGFFIENPLLQQDILFEVEGIRNIKNSILYEQQKKNQHIHKLDEKVTAINKQASVVNKTSVVNEVKEKKIIHDDYKKTFHDDYKYYFDIFPEHQSVYNCRFNKVMGSLKRGDSYLANLTIKTPVKTSLTMLDIFMLSSSPYKIYIPNNFVCFSPESFVKIKDGKISTFPMKGTIDATIPNANEIIINDEKEKAEHSTIVDLLRNDLAYVADKVSLKRFRYIERLNGRKGLSGDNDLGTKSNVDSRRGSLLQVSSEIEGTLDENYLSNIGTIIFKLLPAGSVSGAPKRATLNIIREAEQQKRGFYTGVAGYFDGNFLNSFVLIRFIEQENSSLFFRSGGGITAMSNSDKEYREALQKIYLPF